MFNAINFAFPSETNQLPYPANTTVESAVIAVFLCPSDGQQRVDPINWGGTNYVSNSGTGTINSGNFNVVAGAAAARMARSITRARFASPRSPTGSATPPVTARRSWEITSIRRREVHHRRTGGGNLPCSIHRKSS